MNRPMTEIPPLDALQVAIERGVLCAAPHRPGLVVANLPEVYREALKKLTSDEIQKLRPDA